MRYIIVLLLLVIVVPIYSQDQEGKLGDIIYSILDPDKFIDQHGDGWVIMRGQEIDGSGLHALTGVSRLPDARGMFFRSMNMGRTEGGDPMVDRSVGSYQPDEVIQHTHGTNASYGTSSNWAGGPNVAPLTHGQAQIQPTGGAETRPKNLAFYTYIKIN